MSLKKVYCVKIVKMPKLKKLNEMKDIFCSHTYFFCEYFFIPFETPISLEQSNNAAADFPI